MTGRFERPGARETNPASTDLGELRSEIVPLLQRAVGTTWYEDPENDVDLAIVALCRLRRAGAGARGAPEAGDLAVRDALSQADPATVLWIASRALSYMDEHGFPETLQ